MNKLKTRFNHRSVIFACIGIICLFLVLISRIEYGTLRIYFHLPSSDTGIYPYIAVIVDDRATPLLVNAVLNVLQNIPIDWKVQIFTDPKIWPYYQTSSLASFINQNRVFLTPLPFLRNNRPGDDFINLLLTSVALWRLIQGEKVLYFQIDSVICSNSLYNLSEFLQYDFIGAPWKAGGCCNGGFSIRSRTKTLQLLEHGGYRFSLHEINEDGWFTDNLRRFNAKIAPIDVARKFSVETIYHSRPFAVHKPYVDDIGKVNMTRLCLECPETSRIYANC